MKHADWIERLYGYDLFILHTRRDDPGSAFARALQSALTIGSREKRRKPMRCFLDWRDMPNDDELRRAVEGKIASSRALLLIGGPHAAENEWMRFEAGVARRLRKRILVIDCGLRWANCDQPRRHCIPASPRTHRRLASPKSDLAGKFRGQRTAMNGRNLFKSRAMENFASKFASSGPHLGVFISHSRLDKEKAREVADALKASKVDYYFDENDEDLQIADERGDHLRVVQCIEKGLGACTHLLGIVTENTKNSWWVPYEIGSATGREQECAHLVDEQVASLPSYIKAAKILVNREELRSWLPSENIETFTARGSISERLFRLTATIDAPSFIPTNRTVDELTFYQLRNEVA